MYTRKEILEQIERLYDEINLCQTEIINARLEKDSRKEILALNRMERLAIGAQQELTVIHGHINGHPNWRDVKRIVNLADDLCDVAKEEKWGEEKYYTKVAEAFRETENDLR